MQFPTAFRLGKNSVAFDEFEVRAWLSTRRAR
jgi:predicted DNA-binding transcriptional regulator AlpA